MSQEITSSHYYQECQSIADSIAKECIEESEGNRSDAEDLVHDKLHEAIDGHQWVIYYHGNEAILSITSNEDAWEECYSAEDIGRTVIEKGMRGARTVQAFFAMEADVREYLDEAMDEALEAFNRPKPKARKGKKAVTK